MLQLKYRLQLQYNLTTMLPAKEPVCRRAFCHKQKCVAGCCSELQCVCGSVASAPARMCKITHSYVDVIIHMCVYRRAFFFYMLQCTS